MRQPVRADVSAVQRKRESSIWEDRRLQSLRGWCLSHCRGLWGRCVDCRPWLYSWLELAGSGGRGQEIRKGVCRRYRVFVGGYVLYQGGESSRIIKDVNNDRPGGSDCRCSRVSPMSGTRPKSWTGVAPDRRS